MFLDCWGEPPAGGAAWSLVGSALMGDRMQTEVHGAWAGAIRQRDKRPQKATCFQLPEFGGQTTRVVSPNAFGSGVPDSVCFH